MSLGCGRVMTQRVASGAPLRMLPRHPLEKAPRAMSGSNSRWFDACKSGNSSLVQEYLRQAGFDPRVTDNLGQNGLHLACRHGHFALAYLLLLDGRIDPAMRVAGSASGYDAMHLACGRRLNPKDYEGDPAVALKMLPELLAAVRPALLDSLVHGRTAEDTARQKGHDSLATYIATWNRARASFLLGCRAGDVDAVIEAMAWSYVPAVACNATDADGNTGLHLAAQAGHVEIVQTVVHAAEVRDDMRRFSIDVRNCDGRTPLAVAVLAGQRAIVAELLQHDGTSVNIHLEDKNGDTPFHHAVRSHNKRMIREFLRVRRSTELVTARNKTCQTALDLADAEELRMFEKYDRILGVDLRTMEIDRAHVTVDESRVIGRGGFGIIRPGTLHGQPVVIKLPLHADGNPHDGDGKERKRHFFKEVLYWMLAFESDDIGTPHPNIFPFLGYSRFYALMDAREPDPNGITGPRPIIDPERDWLEGFICPHADESLYLWSWYKKTKPDFWERALHFLCGAAAGVAYLHSLDLVHGDLSVGNILIHGGEAKICDFGLTSMHPGGENTDSSRNDPVPLRHFPGPVPYLAPELIEQPATERLRKRTTATDVYAFGIVCLIVAHREKGDPDFAPIQKGNWKGLDLPSDVPLTITKDLDALTRKCCSPEAAKRPNMEEVRDELARLGQLL
ncbi:kinase-like domain-containing protein [Hyaloraphidium curvatum]|nr:kinase-like domain-containing protein [Hyaloraphidium curvatum]